MLLNKTARFLSHNFKQLIKPEVLNIDLLRKYENSIHINLSSPRMRHSDI